MIETVTASELRRLRERAGVTQAELAEAAEVAVRTIIRWENGHVDIPALAARGLKGLLADLQKK